MSELASGLLTREAIDIIFSGEVIFSAVLTLCIFLLVHSFLTFLKRSGPFYNRIWGDRG